MEESNKEKALAFLKSFETGDELPIKKWVAEEYIPHYPTIRGGKEALLEFFNQIKQMGIKVNVIRAIEDGDHVLLHSEYTGPLIVFDILRFEGGKIVEHWSNSQKEVKATASGHSMTNGPTRIANLDKTQSNKALLRDFVEKVLIGGEYDKMNEFFDDDNYIQHNPMFVDGLSGLLKGIDELASKGRDMKFTKLHMTLGEGNFTLSVTEGDLGEEHVTFYDLFRIQNSKLVEHWDVIEPISPPEEWKNHNGKF